MHFLFFFFEKQTKQCLEIGILQYMWNTVVFLFILLFYFIFVLIFSNHKLVNLLIVIDLFVRVFMFCKYALVVFLSKIKFLSILLHSFLLFSVLFCEISIKSIYLLSMSQNLCEFAQHTLFLNVNIKHMVPVIFFIFFIFHLKFFIWCSLLVFFSVSTKFGACYITGQWGEFRIKNATLYFQKRF